MSGGREDALVREDAGERGAAEHIEGGATTDGVQPYGTGRFAQRVERHALHGRGAEARKAFGGEVASEIDAHHAEAGDAALHGVVLTDEPYVSAPPHFPALLSCTHIIGEAGVGVLVVKAFLHGAAVSVAIAEAIREVEEEEVAHLAPAGAFLNGHVRNGGSDGRAGVVEIAEADFEVAVRPCECGAVGGVGMCDEVPIVIYVEILAERVEAEELGLKLPHVEACAEGLVAPPTAHESIAHGVVLIVAGERAAEEGEPFHRPPLERSVHLHGDRVVGLTGLLVEETVRTTVEHGTVVVLGVPVFYERREEEGVRLVLQVHREHCLIAVEGAERGVSDRGVAVINADYGAGEVTDFRHIGRAACIEFKCD